MNAKDYEALVIKSLTKEITQEENEELRLWLEESDDHRSIYDSISTAWKDAEHYHAEVPTDRSVAWQHIEQNIDKSSPTRILPWVGMAASFLLMVGLAWWSYDRSQQSIDYLSPASYANNTSEVMEINLSDGSVVTLNSNAKIQFTIDEKRSVALQGEAYFDVTHNQDLPFEVHALNTVTTVLGTEFSVDASQEGGVEVFLLEGSVSFASEDKEVLLKPGEWASYLEKNNQLEHNGLFESIDLIWMEGSLEFDNESLESVIAALNKYFDVDIQLKGDFKNCRFTGKFEAPKLEQILDALVFSHDIVRSSQALLVNKCNN